MVIINWFTLPIVPRKLTGDISVRYIGTRPVPAPKCTFNAHGQELPQRNRPREHTAVAQTTESHTDLRFLLSALALEFQ